MPEGLDRLAQTLLSLLDRKPKKPQVEIPRPATQEKVEWIAPPPEKKLTRLQKIVQGNTERAQKDIRPLAILTPRQIVQVAERKGRKLSLADARKVKESAGDHTADQVEMVMYSHGFFDS
ncbi:hypothetical protein KBC80_01065 [Candidatus Woesebacteria bacterium]|nr:hypothetical protein [Candidatus Woesebacteria bacterium]